MKRLQIMIDEDLDQILERMARAEHTSKAALIRRFVRDRLKPLPSIEQDPLSTLVGLADDVETVSGETIDDVVYRT